VLLSTATEQEMHEWIDAFRKYQLDTIKARCEKLEQRV
jgi:hypothetical protein